MGFRTFCILRGSEDLRKLTACSVLKMRIIIEGLAKEYTSKGQSFFCILTIFTSFFFHQKISIKVIQVKLQRSHKKTLPKPAYCPPVLVKLPPRTALTRHLFGEHAMWLWQDPCPKHCLSAARVRGYGETLWSVRDSPTALSLPQELQRAAC